MHAIVHAADVQDRDGGALLMASLFGGFPFLIKLNDDGGYQGPEFQSSVKQILARVNVEIVKRSDQATRVRRTAPALDRRTHLRLARPLPTTGQGLGASLNHKALAFLRLASIASCCENYAIPHDVLGRTLRSAHEHGPPELTPIRGTKGR